MFLTLMWTQAVFAATDEGLLIAPQTGDSITIDGKLDEWGLGMFTADQKLILNADNGFINSGDIDDDDDFSAVVYALYDADNLYFAAVVTDDATDNGSVDSGIWKNDCIELWIDAAGDDGTMTDSGGHDADNYQFNVDVNGCPYVYRNDDAAVLLPQMETAAEMDGTNYTLEIGIPFSALPELNLDVNRLMGLGISFVDGDDGAWNHILWWGEVENQPEQWADLEFSIDVLAVEPAEKLSTRWGLIKKR